MATQDERTEILEEIREITGQVEALHARLAGLIERLATVATNGNGSHTPRVLTPAGGIPVMPTLTERIAQALRERPVSTEDVASQVGAPVEKVVDEIKHLQGDARVYNVGNEARPRWYWVWGPEGRQEDLVSAVRTLIAVQPMELQDLALATGLRPSQVSAILVKLQREGETIQNLGTSKRARWFYPPMPTHVTPKRRM